MHEICKQIKGWRAEIGLTQEAFSRLIGMSAHNLCLIETGHHLPSMRILVKISAAYKKELRKMARSA